MIAISVWLIEVDALFDIFERLLPVVPLPHTRDSEIADESLSTTGNGVLR
jgi:hypothetical protein